MNEIVGDGQGNKYCVPGLWCPRIVWCRIPGFGVPGFVLRREHDRRCGRISVRNHYVPQFLQRPWTSEHDGTLQVFHVNETGVHSTRKPPKSTGYRDDMLALTRDTIGQRNKHEIEQVVLQQVDNDAALVRVKLHNGQLQALTHVERCAWVRFIMSIRIRDPAVVRDLVTQSDQELRRSLAENLNEYVQLADGEYKTYQQCAR